jgi:hypothetical protein
VTPGTPPVVASVSVLPRAAWLKILPGFALAAGTILLLNGPPHAPGAAPSLQLLVLVALAVSAWTVPVLYVVATRDMGIGRGAAACAAGLALMIVVVKFILAPTGVYQVNRLRSVESLFPFSEGLGPVLTGAMIGALYVAVFALLYRLVRDRVERRLGVNRSFQLRFRPLLIIGGMIVLLPAAGIALVIGSIGLQYLDFVFTSAAGTLIGLSLAGAVTLATLGFSGEGKRAIDVGDVGVLLAFFWLGLWFIVLYHVLWIVFAIVLGTVWPLRVVVPK